MIEEGQAQAYVVEKMQAGLGRDEIVAGLEQQGLPNEQAAGIVDQVYPVVAQAAQKELYDSEALMPAIAAGLAAAILGGIVWGLIVTKTGERSRAQRPRGLAPGDGGGKHGPRARDEEGAGDVARKVIAEDDERDSDSGRVRRRLSASVVRFDPATSAAATASRSRRRRSATSTIPPPSSTRDPTSIVRTTRVVAAWTRGIAALSSPCAVARASNERPCAVPSATA